MRASKRVIVWHAFRATPVPGIKVRYVRALTDFLVSRLDKRGQGRNVRLVQLAQPRLSCLRVSHAFFSWPSCGRVEGHPADEACIEASEALITEFLMEFAGNCGAKKIHLIAHSMGSRALLRALQRIAARSEDASSIKFVLRERRCLAARYF
jgi:alpha-beta hydrolase superfamily lysophospholipase